MSCSSVCHPEAQPKDPDRINKDPSLRGNGDKKPQ